MLPSPEPELSSNCLESSHIFYVILEQSLSFPVVANPLNQDSKTTSMTERLTHPRPSSLATWMYDSVRIGRTPAIAFPISRMLILDYNNTVGFRQINTAGKQDVPIFGLETNLSASIIAFETSAGRTPHHGGDLSF